MIIPANSQNILKAAQLIQSGLVVAFPTETVYGLGADAFNEEAVLSIFKAKGRPQDNPLIVHFASVEDVKKAVKYIPDVAYALWEKFSPGPLTLVLPKSDNLPLVTTAGIQTVGLLSITSGFSDKIFIIVPHAACGG